jgi:hypothetical protein
LCIALNWTLQIYTKTVFQVTQIASIF